MMSCLQDTLVKPGCVMSILQFEGGGNCHTAFDVARLKDLPKRRHLQAHKVIAGSTQKGEDV